MVLWSRASQEKGLSPRLDIAAVETIEMRLSPAGFGTVQAGDFGTFKSRFDMKPRATAGISQIFVNWLTFLKLCSLTWIILIVKTSE